MLTGNKIILGVTGGAAACKAPDLAGLLSQSGADVHVVLTKAAQEFVAPAAFALTSNEVITTLFNGKQAMPHIELAKDAAAVIVAPATANVIAKLTHGIADDALTTTILAVKCKVFIAPAMNESMWLNVATRDNVRLLKSRGFIFVGPELGLLACGDVGLGRMAEPDAIIKQLIDYLDKKDQLKGKNILITAGGTQEPIDEVRYLGNRSSGKMGYALAEAAARRGAAVTLISAPSALLPPAGVELIAVQTASQMRDAVLNRFDGVDAVVMAAAVSDYRFSQPAPGKIKKRLDRLNVTLEPTPDVLFELGQRKKSQVLIGFAAECEELAANARRKLEQKHLDLIIANDVSRRDSGFESDFNQALIVSPDEDIPLSLMPKIELAEIVVDKLAALLKN